MMSRLTNFCNSLMLTQVVKEPTRISGSTAGNQTLIDLIFLSHPQLLKQCHVAPPLGTSDHNCIHLSVTHRCHTSKPSKKSQRTIWRYQQADFNRANDLLDEIDWEELLNGDVDQMWSAWEDKFMSIMQQCIPTTKLFVNSKAPWINKAMRARTLSFRRVKRTGRPEHRNDYKKKRNKVANMIKCAKSRYFKRLNPSNPKTFWKLVKCLTKQTSIPILKDSQEKAVHDDTEKATLLNEFFSSCFNNAQPPLNMSDYNEFNQPDQDSCPEQLLCTEDEILEMLLSLDTTKSNGPDGISAMMLKQTAVSIASGITKLMNMSIRSGKFPTAWKTSSVVPIPKGSNHISVTNYRPISLLSIVSKMLEKHIHAGLIFNHLNVHHPIALQQWDFQPKKSTVAALADVTYNWCRALDQGSEVCAVFFDLQKAFDSVPHRPLLDKLRLFDLDPYILRWICSYLMDRKQYVVLNGEQSPACNAISGVPQGSVLGPLLFLMYINDSIRSTALDGNHITLYADDMLLYRVINNPQDFINVQQGIDNIGRWVTENNLRLNSTKCKVMLITRRRTKGSQMPILKLYGQPLERVFEYKYLGVVLSANLSWTPHIDKILAKTRKIIGMLYRQFYQWSDPKVLIKLYTTMVRPHLEYAAPVWSPELIKDISKLKNVQKFALRVCTNSGIFHILIS